MKLDRARRELERVLGMADEIDFADALMELIDCSDDEAYARLPRPLKTAVAVNAFSLEANSGGIHAVIANSSPDVLADMAEALASIGAAGAKRLLEGVRGRFPEGGVPEDEERRAEILDHLDEASGGRALRALDRAYESTGESVLALLKAFVDQQKDEVAIALATWSEERG